MTMTLDALDLRRAKLAELNEKMRRCTACPLARGRTKVVPGEGRIDADIMFIGEAPGYYEDQQGRPFVGAAGQFLEQLLQDIGLKRSDVFIANVIKCRPPSNRDPLPNEIEACSAWLTEQIELIDPKVVVTLGRYSLGRYFPGQPISRIHGQARKFGRLWVVPMYHPAAALHQGSLRRVIEEDFRKLPAYVERALKEYDEARQPPLAGTVGPGNAPATATATALQPSAEQGRLF
ncbi:MAG TPA: uracil-DNA glycosylase [Dehalococcoidia bacterium]|nr:uracil-DNA glycosylase [Dehalococcoidia bacterium]